MTEEISIFLAFCGGLLSFLSPCVLPLIPSYLSLLGGIYPQSPAAGRFRLVPASLCFIFGFSAVFVAFSLFFSTAFAFLGGMAKYINIGAGLIVIVLGLNAVFDFLAFLNYEKRIHPGGRPRGLIGAFSAGAAFAAGWTPCIGPLLTGILLLASQSGKTGTAALYLTAYSAGLALPFLGAAVFFDLFLARAAKLRSRLPLIRRISGILLILIGLLILTGSYTALNIFIQKAQYNFINWAEDQAPFFRFLARYLTRLQEI